MSSVISTLPPITYNGTIDNSDTTAYSFNPDAKSPHDGGAPSLKKTEDSAPVEFSISGHSSGGAMASAHFFAFSDRVIGMGQLESCAAFGTLADAQAAAASGGIAALANIKRAKVYAMQGGDVSCPAGQACHCTTQGDTCDTCGCCCATVAGEFYRTLGADVEIKLVPHAHHGFVTDRGPAELAGCDASVCVPCGDRNRTGDGMVQECGCDSRAMSDCHFAVQLNHFVP
jgi:hypothetical protein